LKGFDVTCGGLGREDSSADACVMNCKGLGRAVMRYMHMQTAFADWHSSSKNRARQLTDDDSNLLMLLSNALCSQARRGEL
jgi:hypothetical protein